MTGLQHIMSHQPPMVFLDEVVESRHEGLTAVVRIRDGIPFYAADRGVPAWVGIEYMAQSIAALAGIRARNAGEDVPLGLIIGCRKYVSTTAAFAPGSELRISVEELIADRATYEQPHQLSVGVRDVWVNGTRVLAGGEFTGAYPGRPVYGPGRNA